MSTAAYRGLVLLAVFAAGAGALRHGEHVHTTKRSQFNEVRHHRPFRPSLDPATDLLPRSHPPAFGPQMRTDWTPLLREFQPRFSEDSELELPSIKPTLLPDNSELKMQFAFDHDHYSETPSQSTTDTICRAGVTQHVVLCFAVCCADWPFRSGGVAQQRHGSRSLTATASS
jgi:hypothetical protein